MSIANLNRQPALDAVRALLAHLGENPDREGLQDTPRRVVKAFEERTRGYADKPHEILATTFNEPCDEMVLLTGIPFRSLCEHHLLGFQGTVDIGYLPASNVVGLSKLARITDCYANRLQIQERLTTEIADAIDKYLQPKGVGVVVRAHHSCMSCRGVMKDGTTMVTSALRGCFKEPATRHEFQILASNA